MRAGAEQRFKLECSRMRQAAARCHEGKPAWSDEWVCSNCTLRNFLDVDRCQLEACKKKRGPCDRVVKYSAAGGSQVSLRPSSHSREGRHGEPDHGHSRPRDRPRDHSPCFDNDGYQ